MSEIKNVTKNVNDEKEDLKKSPFLDAKVKEVLAKPDVQAALKKSVFVPEIVVVKKVNKPSGEHHTQKVEAMFGVTIDDAVNIKFVIEDETNLSFLDPVKAIGKRYRIIDYNLGLDANMSGGSFGGYSATGLKLTVTKIEGV